MDFIKSLSDQFKKDFPRFIILLLIVIIGVFLYPIYDMNYGYLNRLEQRAGVLKILSEIKVPAAEYNIELQKEYDEIVKELSAINPNVESSFEKYFTVSNDKPTLAQFFWKTLAGGIVWLLFILLFISLGRFKFKDGQKDIGKNKFYHRIRYKITGLKSTQIVLISFLIIGCIVGYLIPLFKISSINYVLLPVLELFIFILINKIYQSAKTGITYQDTDFNENV